MKMKAGSQEGAFIYYNIQIVSYNDTAKIGNTFRLLSFRTILKILLF